VKYLNRYLGKYAAPAGGFPRKVEDPMPGALTKLTKPSPELAGPPPPPWDQAEAERLLAALRQAVDRARAEYFGGRFPPDLEHVAADGLAIAAGFVARHEFERRRNWDSLQLLRGMRSHLSDLIARARQQRTA
jgi:hypothetical protein